jgi:hypothetical protein
MSKKPMDIVSRLRNDSYIVCSSCQNSHTLVEAANEIMRFREQVRVLEHRIGVASILLADWDGYYNPDTKRGNAEELASLIEDAYRILQNKSWRDEEPDSVEENTNG